AEITSLLKTLPLAGNSFDGCGVKVLPPSEESATPTPLDIASALPAKYMRNCLPSHTTDGLAAFSMAQPNGALASGVASRWKVGAITVMPADEPAFPAKLAVSCGDCGGIDSRLTVTLSCAVPPLSATVDGRTSTQRVPSGSVNDRLTVSLKPLAVAPPAALAVMVTGNCWCSLTVSGAVPMSTVKLQAASLSLLTHRPQLQCC